MGDLVGLRKRGGAQGRGVVLTLALLAVLAACGSGADETEPIQAGEEGAPTEPAAADQPTDAVAAEDGASPSEPYADLDLDVAAAGIGSVELTDETVQLEVSCPPAQQAQNTDDWVLSFQAAGSGTMADGTRLDVVASRQLKHPDAPVHEGEYEQDLVTLNLIDDSGAPAASGRAAVARGEVGGPVREIVGETDGLPLVKVRDDGRAMTATGVTERLSTAFDEDAPVVGTFRLAMTCE